MRTFNIGLPETARPRLAEVVSNGTTREIPRDSMAYRAEIISRWDPEDLMRTEGLRTAVIPFGNGIGNARSLVKIGSVLANGGSLGCVRLLSEDTCELAYQEQIYTHDHVMVSLGRVRRLVDDHGAGPRRLLCLRDQLFRFDPDPGFARAPSQQRRLSMSSGVVTSSVRIDVERRLLTRK
jgi:hypothetical protein